MPIYEYLCSDCRKVSEFFVARMGGEPETRRCEHCNSKNIERATSAPAVHQSAGKGACASPQSCPTGQCPFS